MISVFYAKTRTSLAGKSVEVNSDVQTARIVDS